MGYEWQIPEGAAAPFVPSSIAFAKQKARELQRMLDNTPVKLSACQQCIASALGWQDWHALEQAVQRKLPPSAPDESIDTEEAKRRMYAQVNALLEMNIHPGDIEHTLADLALTCSPAAAARRRKEIGPWGNFQESPEEVAPGIFYGRCAKFSCYRLSEARQAAMSPRLRVDAWKGWYMMDDHHWRVELSFPDEFSAAQQLAAHEDAKSMEPLLYGLVCRDTRPDRRLTPHVTELLRQLTLAPDSLFVVASFPQEGFPAAMKPDHPAYFAGWESHPETSIACALATGANLLACVKDPLKASALPLVWKAFDTSDFMGAYRKATYERSESFLGAMPFSADELDGWDIPPAVEDPFYLGLFSQRNLGKQTHWLDFEAKLKDIPQRPAFAQMRGG